jgi:hypothetical protein
MKRFIICSAIVVGVTLIVIVVAVQMVDSRGYATALNDLRKSHGCNARMTEFEFVTRGVRAGLTFEQVQARMQGAYLSGTLEAVDRGRFGGIREPFIATFVFDYGKPVEILGTGRDAVYIVETYHVYFDEAKTAVQLEYARSERNNGTQTVVVDLRKQSLDEPLQMKTCE